MSWEYYIAFLVATGAMLAIPGPTVILVVSYALGRGKSSGWATVPGVALGDFTAMTASLLGAGAILAASATLFTVLKLAGAAYLVWLGIKMWRAGPEKLTVQASTDRKSAWGMFWNAYVVTALNPKSIVFFVAFVPQFVDPAGDPLLQFVVLEATFIILAAATVAIWAVLAGHLQSRLTEPGTLQKLQRTAGSFLVGAGILTAVTQRG